MHKTRSPIIRAARDYAMIGLAGLLLVAIAAAMWAAFTIGLTLLIGGALVYGCNDYLSKRFGKGKSTR